MATDIDGEVDHAEAESTRWTSVLAVWINALALAVVLVVTLLLIDNGSIAAYDEGVYAAQADALVHGSWVSERSAADLDPEGRANLLLDSTIVGDGAIAYSRHPLYPVLLVPLMAMGGYSAALFTSVFGVVAAAVCAAFLARRVDLRYGIPALWLAGVASPLVVDAVVLWAHGLAAATAGLTLLGALRAVDGKRTAVNVLVTATAACLTVMLRSEGVLFVAVVGMVVCARSVRWRPPRRVEPRVLALGIGVGIVAVVAYSFDTWWSRSAGGTGSYGTRVATGAFGERGGPADALWNSLLRPGREFMFDVTPILTGASVFIVIGALAVRFKVPWNALPWGLSVMGAVGWVWSFLTMTDTGLFMVTGLFAAFPALLHAALVIGRPELRNVDLATSSGVVLLGTVVLLLFVHSNGGTEWGGRFFHVLLVPAIAPIVAVIDRSRTHFEEVERKLLLLPIALLLFAPTATALKFVGSRKVVIQRQTLEIVRRAPSVRTNGHRPLVIIWRIRPDGTARQFWDHRDDVDLLAPPDARTLLSVLTHAESAGRDEALLVTDAPLAIVNLILRSQTGPAPWEVEPASVRSDGLLQTISIRTVTDK